MAQRQRWTKNAHDHKDDSEEEEEETVLLHANDLNVSCVGSVHNNGVVATLAGCDTAENQDRALLCSPWKGALLLGVFDGHDDDGEAISEHVKNELPKRLAEKLKNQQDDNDDIVVKAFEETFCELHDSLQAASVGGCTASCILKWNTKLYLANSGDSMSMICAARNGKPPQIVFQTRRDIPELPEERERIERMGGAVVCGRVAYQDREGHTRPGVAMSRSIGDSDMIGVIAEPIVNVLDMSQLVDEENRILCISATDGMTDCIPPPELAESLANAFHGKDGHALTAAQDLVLRAAKVWKTKTGGLYRDDITIVACSIEY
jgi:serine/threonine protein phosphatase PrpC